MAAPAPDATQPSHYTPVLTDLLRLVRAPFAPRGVYQEQESAPTFWIPWILICVVSFALQLLQSPFQQRVREIVLQKLNRPVPPAGITLTSVAAGAVGTLVLTLVLAAVAAGILYVVLMVMGGETKFKKMLSVTIFAWPIAVLQQVLTYIVLSIRGVDSIQGVWDSQVSFGADLLVPGDTALSPFAHLFLAGIGPLAIWQLVITVVGLKVLGKAGTGAAWTAALVSFLVMLTGLAALGAVGIKAAGG